jgi:hypothetical protein
VRQAEAVPIVVSASLIATGGAGRHRGGLGITRTVRRSPDHGQHPERSRKSPPWGSTAATGHGNGRFRVSGEWKDDFANAKVLVAQLKAGDAFRISSGGGGGYGPPFERPVEDVREDVRQGYVSAKAARERYGVVVDPQTFAVDESATQSAAKSRSLIQARSAGNEAQHRSRRTGGLPIRGIARRLLIFSPCSSSAGAAAGQLIYQDRLGVFVEVGLIERLPHLLLKQIVQRQAAGEDLRLRCGGRPEAGCRRGLGRRLAAQWSLASAELLSHNRCAVSRAWRALPVASVRCPPA